MSTLRHKKALNEIFTEEMTAGKSLENDCDIVLTTSMRGIPGSAYDLIVLGDFTIADVPTGNLKDKYMLVLQDIFCVAVIKDELDNDEKAEFRAYTLARKVRTILKSNRKLTSNSYPDGIAKESHVSGSPLEYLIHGASECCVVILTLELKTQEED